MIITTHISIYTVYGYACINTNACKWTCKANSFTNTHTHTHTHTLTPTHTHKHKHTHTPTLQGLATNREASAYENHYPIREHAALTVG